MRQALFAILLILAAFSGGALVNGPGLDWAREQLASLSGYLPDGDDPADDPALEEGSSDSRRAISVPAEDELTHSPSDGSPLPVASYSPFDPTRPNLATGKANRDGDWEPPVADGPPPVRAPRGPSIVAIGSPAPEAAAAHLRGLPEPPPSLLDAAKSKLATRSKTSDEGSDDPAGGAMSKTLADPPSGPTVRGQSPEVRWAADAPETAVSAAFDGDVASRTPSDPPPRPDTDPSIRLASGTGVRADADEPDDWAEVRRRMEEMGVGRYWVEGEFGGPVIFRCVVPVIGDRAVSQHFEAEGPDLIAAARVALRRIALWRATEEIP